MNKQYYVKDNKFIIKYKGKNYEIPKPFTNCYFGADPTKLMTIHNRFSDETFQQSCMLPAFAVAIYDTVIGAEQTEDWNLFNKGREWFQKNFIDEYYTLLD
jgi:hypothetical protein